MSRLRSYASLARLAFLGSFLSAVAIAPTAWADLNPGQSQYNPQLAAFSFFTPSYVTGPLDTSMTGYHIPVVSTQFPYNYNGQKDGSFYGWVTSAVWANDAGQLAFTYVFNNLKPPPGNDPNPPLTDIVRATLNDPSNPWAGGDVNNVHVNVNIFQAGSDESGNSTPIPGFFGAWSDGDPFRIERAGSDSSVAFNFNPFNSGTQLNSNTFTTDYSAVMWLTTDATRFTVTNVALSDNGHVGVSQAYAPKVHGEFGTPEPSTFVLAGFAALGGAFTVWRRRRR